MRSDLDQLVLRELTRGAHNRRTAARMAVMGGFGTLMFSAAFYHAYRSPLILGWAVLAVMPFFVRIALNPRVERAESDADLARGLRLIHLNLFSQSVIYMMGLPLMFRPGEHLHNGLLVSWYMMVIGVAASRPLATRRTLLAFVVPTGLALAVAMCFGGELIYWIGAVGVLLYTSAQASAGIEAHGHREQAVQQSLMNQQLAAQLAEQVRIAEEARQEAERAALDKSRFLAAASHDLRQPAHAIALLCDSLRRKHAETSRDVEFRLLSNSVDELNASLNAMLDISRLDSGAVEARLEPVDFSEVCAILHKRFLTRANDKGLAFRCRAGGVHVWADRQMLLRLLGNLVDNALKYTEQGGVLVAARRRGKCVLIEVRDSGTGIAPEMHQRVFDEFYQVGNSARERSQGIGLGLSIVRRLADHMGMDLRLRSALGCGTRLELRCDRALPAPGARAAAQGAAVSPAFLRNRTILVVDNEIAIQRAAASLFHSCGAKVYTAGNPQQALAVAGADVRIDLALVDYRLNGELDGLSLARRFARLAQEPFPVLIVTGDTESPEINRLQAKGIRVVYKPLAAEALLAAASEAIAEGVSDRTPFAQADD